VAQRTTRNQTVSGLAGVRGRVRRIVTLTDPNRAVLRSRSLRVMEVDAAIRRLIADMLVTMRRARGVGLAAVQIGVPLRVLVADSGAGPVALVNPRLRRRRGVQIGEEGCLSIPGTYGTVRRAREVEVDGWNARGRRVIVRGRDLMARVLQHEIDHLNGVLFIDRVAAVHRRAAPGRLRRAAPGRRRRAARPDLAHGNGQIQRAAPARGAMATPRSHGVRPPGSAGRAPATR
jgi:peptide deformylase